jgi:hypothetical protein
MQFRDNWTASSNRGIHKRMTNGFARALLLSTID